MASEIDPILVRALNLLHSKHPKALEQLCALRDEVLGKKPEFVPEKKKEEIKEPIQLETIKKTHVVSTDVITISSDSDNQAVIEEIPETSTQRVGKDVTDGITETVEVESSSLASTEHPDDEIMETVEELGLGYVEETLEELSSSNLLSKRKRPKLEISTGKSVLEDLEVVSRESSPDNEMLPDLAVSRCLICSSGKTGISGNQLVECHECHELYHQGLFVPRQIYCLGNACADKFDTKLTIAKKMLACRIYRYPLRKNCHKPRITDQSINDLRHVWYCRNCSKQIKQAASVTTVPKLKPITSPGVVSSKPQIQSFKPPLRVEAKPPLFSPSSPSVNQSFIIPNLTTSTAASGSNNSALKSPSNANPRDVARNSMKRLQLVKKKAAAKNQQRFTKR